MAVSPVYEPPTNTKIDLVIEDDLKFSNDELKTLTDPISHASESKTDVRIMQKDDAISPADEGIAKINTVEEDDAITLSDEGIANVNTIGEDDAISHAEKCVANVNTIEGDNETSQEDEYITNVNKVEKDITIAQIDKDTSNVNAMVEDNTISEVEEGISKLKTVEQDDAISPADEIVTKVNTIEKDFLEVEDGELDYDEDVESEHVAALADSDPPIHELEKSAAVDDAEEDELLSEEEEGEEGEILSDEEVIEGKNVSQSKKNDDDEEDGEIKDEDLEEGQLNEDVERGNRPRTLCRYFNLGNCRWGPSCRFLHPGVNDKGNYMMHRPPGMYPTAFGKPPPPMECSSLLAATANVPTIMHPNVADDMFEPLPTVAAPLDRPLIRSVNAKETAWERGLKKAKEIKLAAERRKEEDENFEEKRLSLTVGDDRSMEHLDMNKKRPVKQRIAYRENDTRAPSNYYEPDDHMGHNGPPPRRPMDNRPMMEDRRYRERREFSPPQRGFERDRMGRRMPRRSPSPRRHRGDRMRPDPDVFRDRGRERELPVRDIPRNATSRNAVTPSKTLIDSRSNDMSSTGGRKQDERLIADDKLDMPTEAIADSSTAGKPSKAATKKTMQSAEQWKDPWMRTTQASKDRISSPIKSDHSPDQSYSSFSSSVTSGSDYDSDSLSDDSDDSGSNSDSSDASTKVESTTKRKATVQDPRKLASERFRTQQESSEAKVKPMDPRRAMSNRKTSPRSSASDSSRKPTSSRSPQLKPPRQKAHSDLMSDKPSHSMGFEDDKPKRSKQYYDSAIRYDSYEQWRNSQSSANASKHPSSSTSSSRSKPQSSRVHDRHPKSSKEIMRPTSSAMQARSHKSAPADSPSLRVKNGTDDKLKTGIKRFDRVKAAKLSDDDNDHGVDDGDGFDSSSSFGSPTLKEAYKSGSDDDDDDDTLSDTDSDTDTDSDSDSDLSLDDDDDDEELKAHVKAKAASSSTSARQSSKPQFSSSVKDPRFSRNKATPETTGRPTISSNRSLLVDPRRAMSNQVSSTSAASKANAEMSTSKLTGSTKRPFPANEVSSSSSPTGSQGPGSTVARKEELLRELKAVEDAIARKRSKVD